MSEWFDAYEKLKQIIKGAIKMNELNRDSVFEQLKIDEGVVYEIYLDHLGYATFGVGHLIKEHDAEWGQPVGTPVSESRVWECFQEDLDIAINDCYNVFGKKTFDYFPNEVKEIIVNMMFNLGRTRFSGFKKMIAALKVHHWKEAAKEGRDSRWYNQVTNRAERLMSRLEKV